MARAVIDVDVNDETLKAFQARFEALKAGIAELPGMWGEVNEAVQEGAEGIGSATGDIRTQTAAIKAHAEALDRIAQSRASASRRGAPSGPTGPLGTAAGGAAVGSAETAAFLLADKKRIAEEDAKANRAQADADKKSAKAMDDRKKASAQLVKDTKAIAKGVADTTLNLLKWGTLGIGAGLLGGGGLLWGLDRMAGNIGDYRRQAQGLNVSTGDLRAFGLTFQRLVDPQQFLGGVNEAMHNITSPGRIGLLSAGVTPGNRDTAAVAGELLDRIRAIAQQTPDQLMGSTLQARHLDQFVDLQTFERLKTIRNDEYDQIKKQYAANQQAMKLQDDASKAWQDMAVTLKTAGQKIEIVVAEKFAKLAPQIEGLSNAVVDTVKSLLNGIDDKDIDAMGQGIKNVGAWLQNIKPEDFKKFWNEIDHAAMAVGAFGDKLYALAKWLHWVPDDTPSNLPNGKANPDVVTNPASTTRQPDGTYAVKPDFEALRFGLFRPQAMAAQDRAVGLEKYFMSSGWSKSQSAGIAANIMSEDASLNPFAKGDFDRDRVDPSTGKFHKGTNTFTAFGIGQWHEDRQKEYAKHYGHTMQSVTNKDQALKEQLDFINYELKEGLKKSVGDHLKAIRDAVEAGSYVSRAYESPRDKDGEAKKRGALASSITTVTIINTTGGNAAASVNQVAQ